MWGIEKGRSRDAHAVLGGNDIILKLGCNNLLVMKCGIRNSKAYIDRNNGNFLYFILFPFSGVTKLWTESNAKGKVRRAPILLVTTSSPGSECQSISTIDSKLRLQVQPLTWCGQTSTTIGGGLPSSLSIIELQLELTFRNYESMDNNLTILGAPRTRRRFFLLHFSWSFPTTNLCVVCGLIWRARLTNLNTTKEKIVLRIGYFNNNHMTAKWKCSSFLLLRTQQFRLLFWFPNP